TVCVVVYDIILVVVFFFFQAEDGIRDSSVTGVQTCALPIYGDAQTMQLVEIDALHGSCLAVAQCHALPDQLRLSMLELAQNGEEIGRASCREREKISVVDVQGVGKEVRN